MKKKNLKVQVAALAMTGAIAATPLAVMAEEASPVTTGIEATSASSAETASSAAGTSGTEAAGTTTAAEATGTAGSTSTETGTSATETTATGTGATSTEASTAGGTRTETTGRESSTGTEATATESTTAEAAPVRLVEPPVDPATTVKNNVDIVVPDDNKQGTDIVAKAPLILKVDTTITPEEAKGEGTIGDKVKGLPSVLGNVKNKDVVMQGDLSIAKDGSTDFDSTGDAVHEVNKEDSYSLKADLDVNAVNNAINASARLNSLMKEVNIDKMETGLRSTFEMGRDLEGSFHRPTSLEDAKKHYELSSADGSPMMYRINYANSSFAKDKVSIAMDLDLSKYQNPKAEISTFGTLNDLINKSAKKIQLIMKGIKFNAAHGNVEETETATEKTRTAEGTIRGTLVGYMKADVSKTVEFFGIRGTVRGKAAYNWGAIQNEKGRDFVAGRDRIAGNDNGNNKVDLTVKMTTVENKIKPVEPIQPEEPVQPVIPVTPVAPSNGGGNTPSLAPARPSSSTPSNPGTVLGESRPTASTPSGEVLGENRVAPVAETVEKKQGAVLGESRPSVKGVSDRASVATGDYNFTGLWASLFGISLASLAGFVVLQKKKEN
jgi:cell wall surface anchor family protein